VDSTGKYTAPSAQGTYHVVATTAPRTPPSSTSSWTST
jgi:hypothetical protein